MELVHEKTGEHIDISFLKSFEFWRYWEPRVGIQHNGIKLPWLNQGNEPLWSWEAGSQRRQDLKTWWKDSITQRALFGGFSMAFRYINYQTPFGGSYLVSSY